MRDWMELLRKSDWTEQKNSEGLTVHHRPSERKLNTMKASKILPFAPIDVFRTLNAGYLRQTYDENVIKTESLSRICANIKILY